MKLVILLLSQKVQRPEFVERDLIKQANKTLGKFAVEHSSYYPRRSVKKCQPLPLLHHDHK